MKKYLAEFIGTYGMVFCGTGAIVVNETTGGQITHVGVAMTFGLVVVAMIYAFGETSGAHLNPSVTLGFWALKKFPIREIAPYIGSQLAGALAASGTLRLLFPENAHLGATLPRGSTTQSFVLEVILTYFLMLVIIKTSQGSKETGVLAGLAIGATVMLEAMFAGPICGASMNPARSIAPAVVSGNVADLWIYIFAPVGGAVLAAFTGRFFLKN